jgi:hypothetical protein
MLEEVLQLNSQFLLQLVEFDLGVLEMRIDRTRNHGSVSSDHRASSAV